MAKSTAKAKDQTATASALPESEAIPEGFKKLGGDYAPAWIPEERPVLHGRVTGEVRVVEFKTGRKKKERRCMEVTAKKSGEAFTVWESAALGDLFDTVADKGPGMEVYLKFDGYGTAKPGQNAPKLFQVGIKE